MAVVAPAHYKNTQLVLEAFQQARRGGLGAELVLVGTQHDDEVELIPGVRSAGWVGRARLRDLMSHARAVLFPSRVESFGLPALESIEAGTPVLVLRSSTMARELAPHVVALDEDPRQWATELIGADFDSRRVVLRTDETRKALHRRFDWSVVAERTANVYRSSVANRL